MATEKTTTTAIAVRSSMDLEALDEFDQILLGQAEVAEIVDDPEEISREIIAQLLAAKSDEELDAGIGKAQGWRELMGVPVWLLGFRWRPSSFDEGGPVYVVVQAVNADTGEAAILTTGSANVLAQLSNMARRAVEAGATRLSESPWRLVQAENATRNGFKPLHLERVQVEG